MLVWYLGNYRQSETAVSRKLKKYYPASTSLIFAYSEKDFHEKSGAVLETYVVNTLDAKYYFRDRNHEVDVVIDGVPSWLR